MCYIHGCHECWCLLCQIFIPETRWLASVQTMKRQWHLCMSWKKRFHAFSCEGSVYPISLNLVYIAISLNLVCIAINLKNRTCTSFMEKQSKAAFWLATFSACWYREPVNAKLHSEYYLCHASKCKLTLHLKYPYGSISHLLTILGLLV